MIQNNVTTFATASDIVAIDGSNLSIPPQKILSLDLSCWALFNSSVNLLNRVPAARSFDFSINCATFTKALLVSSSCSSFTLLKESLTNDLFMRSVDDLELEIKNAAIRDLGLEPHHKL
jgi:hypothetical protein